jgi:secondary thiamine-phosphate synthase enzyme
VIKGDYAVISRLTVPVKRQGLQDITNEVSRALVALLNDEQDVNGLCTLFIQHTSASLLIQENYDPSAREDLETWLNRLVPEQDSLYTHTVEGPDDMPAHIKSALTATSVSVPVIGSRLALGTWQGIFLWEHRSQRSQRNIIMHFSR